MSGDDDHPAEDQLAEMLPALSSDQDVIDQVLNRLGMVQILASVIARSSDEVQRQIATDLGYGSADVKQGGIKRPAPADGSAEEQAPVIGPLPLATARQMSSRAGSNVRLLPKGQLRSRLQ
eukprot:Skav216865  [mRNA]  locus=scaffold1042:253981:254343:- [translate_table: standard]